MRVYESREFSIHFDAEDTPEPIMIDWGGYARRRRLQPRSVLVKWRRKDGEEWQLWHIWVFGDHVHAQSSSGIGTEFIDGGRELKPLPDWLTEIVELGRPIAEVSA